MTSQGGPLLVSKHYLRTTQGELHYRSCGEEGPVFALLQILPFGTQMLEPLLPLLAQAGLRCIAIDIMGYGRSDKRPGPWMIEDFAANIDEALNRLDIAPDYLLGGHTAGMIAAAVALLRGARVRKLVLDGTPVWPLAYRRNIAAEMDVKSFEVTQDGQFMADSWNLVLSMMRLLNKDFEVTPHTATTLRDFAVQLLETTYGPSVTPAMAAFDMALLLPRLSTQTLILTSENDSQTRFFDQLMGGVSGAKGRIFKGVHPMHDIARPHRVAEYAEELLGFLIDI
jgi:pimeloyl-ACP methyl ester carboxylesterase